MFPLRQVMFLQLNELVWKMNIISSCSLVVLQKYRFQLNIHVWCETAELSCRYSDHSMLV
jgi:hypothetical protein